LLYSAAVSALVHRPRSAEVLALADPAAYLRGKRQGAPGAPDPGVDHRRQPLSRIASFSYGDLFGVFGLVGVAAAQN
jgi:hypothetical protein